MALNSWYSVMCTLEKWSSIERKEELHKQCTQKTCACPKHKK